MIVTLLSPEVREATSTLNIAFYGKYTANKDM